MKQAWTVAAIRRAEDDAMAALVAGGGTGGELMQRAAEALAAEIRRLLGRRYGARVLLLCGPGNNAGDGLYAAVRLLRKGIGVRALRVFGRTHEEGWAAFTAAGGREVDLATALTEMPRTGLVVDAILGIGGRSGLSGDLAELARACAAPDAAPLLAVDLPSGLDADTAEPDDDSFRADHTLTFGTARLCHLLGAAAARCGEVTVADIGLDSWLSELDPTRDRIGIWQVADLARAWPVPDRSSDKYSRGVVGIDAGSQQYPGAGRLATAGAVHGGAGMVRFAGPQAPASLAAQDFPNIIATADADDPGRVQAWVVGSGWGQRDDGTQRLARRAEAGTPLVIDADGLRHLPQWRASGGADNEVLITPHAGELARLLEIERTEVQSDPMTAARAAADRFEVTVLLKGSTQYVVTPAGQVTVALPGPGWTAQAGSGDVLAGLCGTTLAAGLDAATAALAAASAQALAARRHPGPLAPQELAATLPELLGVLTCGEDR